MKIQEKAPLVSVVMPAYNVEKYVEEAVRSILDQTFLDFEFIIVDDGSTDRTLEILRSFSDPRIRLLFNEKNEGNYPARNRGCRLARGKYIAVMDADDVAMPERLEVQVKFMEKNFDVLLIGSGWHFMGNTDRPVNVLTDYEDVKLYLLNNSCFLHPSMMIRTEVMQAVGGYDEQYVYAGDYDLLCRFALRGRVENIPDVLMAYRWHPEQITQKHRPQQRYFADEVRRNYHQQFVSLYKTNDIKDVNYYIVGYPMLGECICLYVYARHKSQINYEEKADELLEHILLLLQEKCIDNQITTLCSIGCGILYLLRMHLAVGDEQIVLENIDQRLSQFTFLDVQKEDVQLWGAWNTYLSMRKCH